MKKIAIISVLFLSLASGGYLLWQNRPRPALETKFVVDDIRTEDTTDNSQDLTSDSKYKTETNSVVPIQTPGDYALVDLPTHTYQTFNNCGPATLSMILNRLGENISQKELGDKMRPYQVAGGDNDDKTIFTYEFVDWAKKYGYNAVGRVNGDIELLKKFTANGIPVVVKTWLHPGEDIGHFRIVRGFDDKNKVIIQDDSYEGPNRKIAYYDFLGMWQPFNYNYIIVYTNAQADLVDAILGSERDERTAWQNALERARKENELDPDNVYPWFNMSTAYYHLGQYQKSVEAFERVETRLPKRMLWYQIEPIQAYRELGKYDRVFSIIQNILDNGNRAYSELYQMRGEIYLEQGKRDAARHEFEMALQYNKNYEKARQSLDDL